MEDEIEEAQEMLDKMGLEGKLVKRLINGVKAKGRAGKGMIDALVVMGEATKLSQLAEKAYVDMSTGRLKGTPDFDKAEEFIDRSIKLLDKAIGAFPTTAGTLLPVRKKLLIQQLDIRYQRVGTTKSIEELEMEVGSQ